jgi:hypothetical protein
MSPMKLTARYDLYLTKSVTPLNSVSYGVLGPSYVLGTRSAAVAHEHGMPRHLPVHRFSVHRHLLPSECENPLGYQLEPWFLKGLELPPGIIITLSWQ